MSNSACILYADDLFDSTDSTTNNQQLAAIYNSGFTTVVLWAMHVQQRITKMSSESTGWRTEKLKSSLILFSPRSSLRKSAIAELQGVSLTPSTNLISNLKSDRRSQETAGK